MINMLLGYDLGDELIREIGKKIILRNNYSIDYINDLVLDYLKIQ